MSDAFTTPGKFSWAELMTTDVDGAKQFYGSLFGWTTKDMPMEELTYSVVANGDEEIAGMMPIPPGQENMPPMWGTYVTVANVDETAAKAESLGGKILMPPKDVMEGMRLCLIQDPQGAVISIISYPPK